MGASGLKDLNFMLKHLCFNLAHQVGFSDVYDVGESQQALHFAL